MLSENQCRRLLKQTEKSLTRTVFYIGDDEWAERRGWEAALKLVLEIDGPVQIRNTPLEEKE